MLWIPIRIALKYILMSTHNTDFIKNQFVINYLSVIFFHQLPFCIFFINYLSVIFCINYLSVIFSTVNGPLHENPSFCILEQNRCIPDRADEQSDQFDQHLHCLLP